MAEYQWEDAKILSNSRWDNQPYVEFSSSRYAEYGQQVHVKALDREPSRENIARAFLLACNRSLEYTFDTDDYGRSYGRWFGSAFSALLERAAGAATVDLDQKTEEISHLISPFFAHNADAMEIVGERPTPPDFERVKRREINAMTGGLFLSSKKGFDWRDVAQNAEDVNSWFLNDSAWAKRLFDEMYYTGMKKLMDYPYPEIDYSNHDQLNQYADQFHALGMMGADLVQGISDKEHIMEKRIAENHPDITELIDNLALNSKIRKAMSDVNLTIEDPIESKDLQAALEGRIILDIYGANLSGMSAEDASKFSSLSEANRVNAYVADFLENCKPEKYQQVKDYIEGKPNAVAPFYMKDGIRYMNAAFDNKIPNFDLPKMSVSASNAEKFDSVFAEFKDHPSLPSEAAVKRIYIDGKNAYDMFKNQYQGDENGYEDYVKEEIVRTLTGAKQRVEFLRMDMDRDGFPKATIVPVTANLSGLDAQKKWYEHSLVKQMNQLWSNDKERENRRSQLAKDAEERQRAKMLSAAYHSSFYNDTIDELNKIQIKYVDKKFAAAEQKMKENPETARKWMYSRVPAVAFSGIVRDLYDMNKNFDDIKADPRIDVFFPKTLGFEKAKNPAREILDQMIDVRKSVEDSNTVQKTHSEYSEERLAHILNENREELEDSIRKILRTQNITIDPDRKMLQFGPDNRLGLNVEHGDMKMAEMDRLFLGEVDPDQVEAYDDYMKVRCCNTEIMEKISKNWDAKTTTPNRFGDESPYWKTNPEEFRNDLRSLRSLMEMIGINQEDLNRFGEALSEKEKESFEKIRNWEKDVLNGSFGRGIPVADGAVDVKHCADQMLKIYQDAYYEKLGYAERLDPSFQEQIRERIFPETAKKPLTYEDLVEQSIQRFREARRMEELREAEAKNNKTPEAHTEENNRASERHAEENNRTSESQTEKKNAPPVRGKK